MVRTAARSLLPNMQLTTLSIWGAHQYPFPSACHMFLRSVQGQGGLLTSRASSMGIGNDWLCTFKTKISLVAVNITAQGTSV